MTGKVTVGLVSHWQIVTDRVGYGELDPSTYVIRKDGAEKTAY